MTNIQFEQYKLKKSIDGVLGTRTRGGRMEGTDESTELWRHPIRDNYLFQRLVSLVLCYFQVRGCVSPTSIVTIAAPSRVANHRRGLSFGDDSSSTKTEIEEMDQFSDLDDNPGTGAGAADYSNEEDKKAAKVSEP